MKSAVSSLGEYDIPSLISSAFICFADRPSLEVVAAVFFFFDASAALSLLICASLAAIRRSDSALLMSFFATFFATFLGVSPSPGASSF